VTRTLFCWSCTQLDRKHIPNKCSGNLQHTVLYTNVYSQYALYGVVSLSGLTQDAKPGKSGGELIAVSCTTHMQPSFVNYIKGGMEMQFSCAIDYTGILFNTRMHRYIV
jgi:hypothetical protein